MSDHATEHEEAPSYDDINTSIVVMVGAISAVVTLITIFFIQGLCYHWQNSFLTRKTSEDPSSLPAVVQVEEQKSLLDGGEGLTSIEESMSKVVAQYGK